MEKVIEQGARQHGVKSLIYIFSIRNPIFYLQWVSLYITSLPWLPVTLTGVRSPPKVGSRGGTDYKILSFWVVPPVP